MTKEIILAALAAVLLTGPASAADALYATAVIDLPSPDPAIDGSHDLVLAIGEDASGAPTLTLLVDGAAVEEIVAGLIAPPDAPAPPGASPPSLPSAPVPPPRDVPWAPTPPLPRPGPGIPLVP